MRKHKGTDFFTLRCSQACDLISNFASKLPELWKSFIKRTERELKRATENPSRGQKRPKVMPGVCKLIDLLHNEVR